MKIDFHPCAAAMVPCTLSITKLVNIMVCDVIEKRIAANIKGQIKQTQKTPPWLDKQKYKNKTFTAQFNVALCVDRLKLSANSISLEEKYLRHSFLNDVIYIKLGVQKWQTIFYYVAVAYKYLGKPLIFYNIVYTEINEQN